MRQLIFTIINAVIKFLQSIPSKSIQDYATDDDYLFADGADVPNNDDDVIFIIPSQSSTPKTRYLWILDPGHGVETPGKRSPDDELREYEFTRDIVRRIGEQLKPLRISYHILVDTNYDMSLLERVNRANDLYSNLPKRYISIHGNAFEPVLNEWNHANGIETWFFHESDRGREMAYIFQKHLVRLLKWKDRGIRSRPTKQFYVLKNTNFPAILTESGFYTNRVQKDEMMKDAIRADIALAHVQAIIEYEERVMTIEHLPMKNATQ